MDAGAQAVSIADEIDKVSWVPCEGNGDESVILVHESDAVVERRIRIGDAGHARFDLAEGVGKVTRQRPDVSKAQDGDPLRTQDGPQKSLELGFGERAQNSSEGLHVGFDDATQEPRSRSVGGWQRPKSVHSCEVEIHSVLDARAQFLKVPVAKEGRKAHDGGEAHPGSRGQFAGAHESRSEILLTEKRSEE